MTTADAVKVARGSLANALIIVLVQLVLYVVTVRDDVRDVKQDMREVRCEMAVGFKRPTLPEGCNMNTAALRDAGDGNDVVQSGAARP